MDNSKLFTKRLYNDNKEYPLSLKEYLIIDSEDNNSKDLLIKLIPNPLYDFQKATVEITQQDKDKNKLVSAKYNLEIPQITNNHKPINKKIKIHPSCEFIQYELIEAVTEYKTWNNNTWHNNVEIKSEENEVNSKTQHNIKIIKRFIFQLPFYVTFIVLMIHILLIVGVFYLLNV